MTGFACPETEALRTTLLSMAGEHPVPGEMPARGGKQAALCKEPTLIQRIRSGDFDARQKLITTNLRAVLENNRRYARNGVGIFDLLKAGNLGLAHALDTHPAEAPGSFPEYAAACIRRHVELALKTYLQQTPARSPASRRQDLPADACPG